MMRSSLHQPAGPFLADLKKADLLDGQPGASILLGTFAGRDVRYSGDSHFSSIAMNRFGDWK